MQVVKVNKPSDPQQLKILFPNIKLALNDVPAYGKVVYTNFQFPLSNKTELVFEQSNSGYNLETHLGLQGFLQEIDYMPVGKLKRFISAGKAAVLDSYGHVVSPEGIFHSNPNVSDMYFFCSSLKVSNRVFLEDEIEQGYLLDVLESPLFNRLAEVDRVGYEKSIQKILQLMDSYYDPSIKFNAKRDSKGVSGFDRMARLMNSFNLRDFKEFSLSGDMREDAYVLVSFFG